MPINLDQIRSFIQVDILNDPEVNIADDQDLLLSGLLDSLNILKLVNYLEKQCNITIPPEDVLIEHFGSLAQIHSYLSGRAA